VNAFVIPDGRVVMELCMEAQKKENSMLILYTPVMGNGKEKKNQSGVDLL
jgi:hypothetical protein